MSCLRLLFLCLSILFLYYPLEGYENQPESKDAIFFHLDNVTPADYDDVVDDPFLVLRTKVTSKEESPDVVKSWEHFANFDVFSVKPFPQNNLESEPIFKLEEISDLIVSVTNTGNVFDHIIPMFHLNSSEDCEKIWWQISSDENFEEIIPNFEGIQAYETTVSLDKLTDTFFNLEKTYYFRVKGLQNGLWGHWSSSFSFRVLKPKQLQDAVFNKSEEYGYTLSWEGSLESNTNYLVFGSNSLDFIPSIYFDKQINHIENGEIVDFNINENLVEFTQSTSIQIDDRFAYYRIIAEKDGKTSIPSPIINVFDDGLSIPRYVLQRTSTTDDQLDDGISSGQILKRISFPPAYSFAKITSEVPISALETLSNYFHLDERVQRQIDRVNKLDFQTYAHHPYVAVEVWNTVQPYFLPENHPIKARLDRIFNSNQRVTLNSSTMKKAGFNKTAPMPYSGCVVTTHPKLIGFYIKLFKDDQAGKPDWILLRNRVYGARTLRNAIDSFGYGNFFKVPGKWIYPLPSEPSPPPGYDRKNFILIAEDMHILSDNQNRAMWKNDAKMTKERLRAFYILLRDQGLADSNHYFNVPFSSDGKISFIDLERHHEPVNYGILSKYLSKKGQILWAEIVAKDGAN